MARTVLVCDDSLLMRKMVSEILEDAGWTVVGEAVNGEDAAAAYDRLRPAAVTMDIVMPDADGIAGLRQIMALDPDAKVVIVSALNETRMISEAIRLGAFDFIVKPFLPETLQDTLQRAASELVAV